MFYKKGYKYQLYTDYTINIPIKNVHINTSYIQLVENGDLTIKHGYAWDGATGAIDTNTIIRASLVHDALYQLMRDCELDRSNKEIADKIFRTICKEDGMIWFRRWYIYHIVKYFGLLRKCLPKNMYRLEKC